MTGWLVKNVRVEVTRGRYAGRCGRLVKDLGRGEWMVHLDGRFGGSTVAVADMRPDTSVR